MRLMVSAERAEKLVRSIPHRSCHSGMLNHWRASGASEVTAASFLWLYCWAHTGMGREKARAASVEAFEEIFGFEFPDVARRVDHEWARRMRYVGHVPDEEVSGRLGGLHQKGP